MIAAMLLAAAPVPAADLTAIDQAIRGVYEVIW